jgi:hypothetical protein
MLDAFKNQRPSSAPAAATNGGAKIDEREKTGGRRASPYEKAFYGCAFASVARRFSAIVAVHPTDCAVRCTADYLMSTC